MRDPSESGTTALPPWPVDGASSDSGFPFGKAFAVLLTFSALFRLIYTTLVPLTGDELMHWEWSRHLALGYPEHPPMIAWSIAIDTAVFGTFQWSVRLVSVLAVTGLFWILFRLGKELFGDKAAFLGAVALMATPLYNAGGVVANTDGLLGFFWILTVYGIKMAVLDRRRAGWLLAGVAAGFCLLSKLSGMFLFPATLLFLLGSSEGRGWLRRWEPYGAAVIASLISIPVVVWNMEHGWFNIAMRLGHQTTGRFTLFYAAELLGAQLLVLSPVLCVWVLWALWRSWRLRADIRALLLGTFMAVPFLFYVAYTLCARAGVHWPGVGYPTGFVLAGALTAAMPRLRARRWFAAGIVPAMLLTGGLFVLPMIPRWIASIPASYRFRPDKLNTEKFNDIIDWGVLGNAVQETIDETDGEPFVLCRYRYGLAGAVGFYTPSRPEVFLWEIPRRNGAAYELWKAEADLRGRNAVIVEDSPNQEWFDELRCCFDSLSELRHIEIRRGDEVLKEFYLIHGTNFSGFPPERMAAASHP